MLAAVRQQSDRLSGRQVGRCADSRHVSGSVGGWISWKAGRTASKHTGRWAGGQASRVLASGLAGKQDADRRDAEHAGRQASRPVAQQAGRFSSANRRAAYTFVSQLYTSLCRQWDPVSSGKHNTYYGPQRGNLHFCAASCAPLGAGNGILYPQANTTPMSTACIMLTTSATSREPQPSGKPEPRPFQPPVCAVPA